PQYEGDFNEFSGNTYGFQFLSTQEMLRILSKKIIAQPVGEQSMILELSYQGENITKNEAILNNLVKQFNQDGIEDRRAVSKRTAEFIEKRLVSLAVELDTVETKKVEYKELSDLVTLESSATQLFMKEGGAESKRYELENQLEVAKIFKEQLVNGKEYSLLPANLGIENSSVNNLTQEYNTGVLELQRLLISATPQNPVVTHQKDMLDNIRGNIIESINTYINSLNISLQNIQLREAVTSSRLGNLPEQEKHIRNIERQQEIKERLYLFLLQKREEANLQYAITTPTIKVVDYAFTDPEAVSPKSKIILLAALILGLLIPFGILYLRFLLNTKIESKDQLKKIVGDIPVVAEIPQLEKNNAEIIRPNDRTVLAEAFRILRTNLSYMSPSRKDENQGQVIYVTSTTKGEGKTFTTVNLGITYSTTNKKVLVVGCDLRNPQLHNYIQRDKNTAGVSSYLYDENVDFDSLIIHDPLKYGNLDIILSGNIPPNPAELLMTKRFESFLNEAKSRYDYILVDTAPTILVTDTLLISSLADISVYLVRAGVTESKLLEHVKELHKHKKLRNIGIVINGLQEKGSYGYKYGYNYGYGYGYSDESPKRRFFKFWKKRK
ncbi:MAG TPA: polysaccharide biosynthesis tyrosine autokinase, partial [Flavobacteriaceae bacterium]|nr:polysaccharide biosynthesis tyrosine autokinase [Flavobacteriaceae bacterium]